MAGNRAAVSGQYCGLDACGASRRRNDCGNAPRIHKNWPGIASVRVDDAGSFSSTARQRNLSPAEVGKSFGQLVCRPGIRKFNRTSRRFSMNLEGDRALKRARGALHALDAL